MNQHLTNGFNSMAGPDENHIEKLMSQRILKARVYQPPAFKEKGLRLYLNENLFGPSPKCLSALKNIKPEQLYLYHYNIDESLGKSISKVLGVEYEQVFTNHGTSAIIQQIFQGVLDAGDCVYLPKPGWDYYRCVSETLGAKIQYYSIDENDDSFSFNVNKMVDNIKKIKPKLVVITSPNMPSGNTITYEQLSIIADSIKNGVLLLDEAYYGFSKDYSMNLPRILSEYENIIVTRTFSKLYGLASARVGFGVTNGHLCKMFKKIGPLFGLPWISQQLAKIALEDNKYYEGMCNRISNIRERFYEDVNNLGMQAYKSKANFVLVNAKGYSAKDLITFCCENGYIIRSCIGYGLANHIRVSIGKEEHMNDIAGLFKKFVGESK